MRSSFVCALACALLACSVDLSPSDPVQPKQPVPSVLEDCLPLTHSLSELSGRIDAQALLDTTTLLTAGDHAFRVTSASGTCNDSVEHSFSQPIFDGAAILVSRPVSLLAGVDDYRYFSAENTGIGVARWNPARGSFEGEALLFTADRPRFGSGAARSGDYIYVFGGLAARFLAADVYLARVPVARITEHGAYEYWQGGGTWTSDPDLAAPVLEGGVSPSVSFDAAHARWLMAYATPLATEIQVRTGLGVTGPWSQPQTLGRCRLPLTDRDAFCDDVTLLPAATDTITLAYRVGSFTTKTRDPHDYWTRLATTPWPLTLP